MECFPSPKYAIPQKAIEVDTDKEVFVKLEENKPFSALVFKIMTDPFVGKLAFFRVYSGTCDAGSYVYNSVKNKRERFGRILMMHANHREEIDKVYAGDIAAAVGLIVAFCLAAWIKKADEGTDR